MRNDDPSEQPAAEDGSARDPREDGPSTNEYTVAFTPRQLAGGFAILAAILVLLLRRGRRGRRRPKD